MLRLEDLKNKISSYATEKYDIEETTIVPSTDYSKLTFGNKGLTCEFTFMFMDIRKSSQLQDLYGFKTAARIYQSFHEINVRVITANSGSVRAFDGDRIMGVFAGDYKNTSAATAALEIQWAVRSILNPTLGTTISCGSGIDMGKTLVTKVGKGRNTENQDLVWVGKACNYASHLSNEANNSIIISTNAYDRLAESKKVYNGSQVWQPKIISLKNGSKVNCHETTWGWTFT